MSINCCVEHKRHQVHGLVFHLFYCMPTEITDWLFFLTRNSNPDFVVIVTSLRPKEICGQQRFLWKHLRFLPFWSCVHTATAFSVSQNDTFCSIVAVWTVTTATLGKRWRHQTVTITFWQEKQGGNNVLLSHSTGFPCGWYGVVWEWAMPGSCWSRWKRFF